MKKAIIMLILSLLPLVRAGAQYYETGQDPASFRWLQIRTPNFRVIYPDDFGRRHSVMPACFRNHMKSFRFFTRE
ncbi:MAG: hypothetical protein R2758_01535 [Bacteroidales bacterium]